MRIAFICAAVISGLSISSYAMAASAPAAASAAVSPEHGDVIHSSDGAWVGQIDYVSKAKDGAPGYVGVIRDGRVVHIPSDTLSAGPKGLTSSLKIRDIDKLP